MNLSSFGNILQSMYTDEMDIYRYTEVEDTDGTTTTKLSNSPLYTDVPCRISFSSPDEPETTREERNPIYLRIKVFCSSTVDISKGDRIIARRLDEHKNVLATYEGTANLPYVFVTHKEILLTEVGDA